MEQFNHLDKKKKYPKMFKLTKKFKTYARENLKAVPDIFPILSGANGTISHTKRPEEHTNTNFWQEIILGTYGFGTIFNGV